MSKKEKIIRACCFAACEIFAIFTIVYLFVTKQSDRLLLAAVTPFIIAESKIIEMLFRCRINLPVYLICLFYAIGPMLGQCYNLYYTVAWWDKMLHMLGGVMFAFFGMFLFERFAGRDKKKASQII